MAVPTDLVEDPTVMSYAGLVDASTAEGQVDEEADWGGAVAALLTANTEQRPAPRAHRPYAHPLSELRRR